MHKITGFAVAFVVAFVAFGCSDLSDEAAEESGVAELPVYENEGGECEEVKEFSICEYVVSLDLIVLGSIKDKRKANTYANPSGDELQQCDGWTEPGMEIDLEIKQTLYGDTDNDVLTVHLGANQVTLWQEDPFESNGTLEVGDLVGVQMVKDDAQDLWTTGLEPLFVGEVSGIPFQYQERAETVYNCSGKPFKEIDGSLVEDFSKIASNCDGDVDAQDGANILRDRRSNMMATYPQTSHASVCGETPDSGDYDQD